MRKNLVVLWAVHPGSDHHHHPDALEASVGTVAAAAVADGAASWVAAAADGSSGEVAEAGACGPGEPAGRMAGPSGVAEAVAAGTEAAAAAASAVVAPAGDPRRSWSPSRLRRRAGNEVRFDPAFLLHNLLTNLLALGSAEFLEGPVAHLVGLDETVAAEIADELLDDKKS